MFKELSQLGSLLKQAQSLSGKMQDAQQRIGSSTFEGTGAAGLVRVTLSGHGRVIGCHVSDELLNLPQKSGLETAIVEAVNNALDDLKTRTADEMRGVTDGLDVGGLGSLLGGLGGGPRG